MNRLETALKCGLLVALILLAVEACTSSFRGADRDRSSERSQPKSQRRAGN